jgi:deazaflavin-dependent oxidoreductase (nitroreductase family)
MPISNFFMKAIINSPLHFLLGDSFAVITLTGRKTGRRYSTPINVKRQGETWYALSMRSRTWWRNLRGGGLAQLRVAGKQIAVRGEVVEGHDEVAAGLADYFRQYPGYAKYFDIRLGPDGQPDPKELRRVAGERVIIRLCPG